MSKDKKSIMPLHPTADAQTREKIIARTYMEFQSKNRNLLSRDPQQYYSELRRYVELETHRLKYGMGAL